MREEEEEDRRRGDDLHKRISPILLSSVQYMVQYIYICLMKGGGKADCTVVVVVVYQSILKLA